MKADDLSILQAVFDETSLTREGPARRSFRAKRPGDLDRMDELERIGYLRADGDCYRISASVLRRLPAARAKALLLAANAVFEYLKGRYVEDQDRRVPLSELASDLQIQQDRILEVVGYMIEFPWWSARSTDLSDPDAYVIASEQALRLESFDAALDKIEQWHEERLSGILPDGGAVVASPSGPANLHQHTVPDRESWIARQPLPDFLLSQSCGLEEDSRLELKEVNGKAVRAIADVADEYAVAFLNNQGGTVFWGIRDSDAVVTGVRLGRSERDEVRRRVAEKLRTIQPPLPSGHLELRLHALGQEAEDLYVVTLSVPPLDRHEPFYTASGELFVRADNANHKLKGPQLTAWLRERYAGPRPFTPHSPASEKLSPELLSHAGRFRQLLAGSGIEPGHLSRFLTAVGAPFSCSLADLASDHALLRWLDDEKTAWFCETLRVRREWVDGEDERIYEQSHYDKDGPKFWGDVQRAMQRFPEGDRMPVAYFVRAGRGKEWESKGGTDIHVVVGIPITSLSEERTVYHYLTDSTPYPWNYARTQIQLRAWARLLHAAGFMILGRECDLGTAEALSGNAVFLWPLLEAGRCAPSGWHIEDYALSSEESAVAKGVESFPLVLDFLKTSGLPHSPLPRWNTRTE